MPRMIAPVLPAGTLSSMTQPRIEVDAELGLRPFVEADAPAVLDAFNDPDIVRWHFRRFDRIGEAEGWIADVLEGWATEESANWAITARADDRMLGRVNIYPDLEQGMAEIGYWVLPAARGHGVASRSVVALTAWAHALGIHRISLEHSTLNHASCAVAERCGFRAEGVMRGAHLLADGRHDVHLHAHLATDDTGVHR